MPRTLQEIYTALSADLRYDMQQQYSKEYDELRPKIPMLVGLLDRIMKKTGLSESELDQLITDFPAQARQYNMPDVAVRSFEKQIVPLLQEAKAALQLQQIVYTQEEDVAAVTLESFWLVYGQKLSNVCHNHPAVGACLDKFLDAGRALNKGPSWNAYQVDRPKFRAALLEAIGLPRAGDHQIYGPLAQGAGLLHMAKTQLAPQANTHIVDYKIIYDAKDFYEREISNSRTMSLAKDAVARQAKRTIQP